MGLSQNEAALFLLCRAVGILPKTASFKMPRIKSVISFTVFYKNTHGAAHISKKSALLILHPHQFAGGKSKKRNLGQIKVNLV